MDKNLQIIFEDDSIIVVNKPKNLLVHPTVYNEIDTLIDQLKDKIFIHDFPKSIRPGIIHRLDRNTTGLMVIAKNKLAFDSLSQQINERKLIRKYLAIVHRDFEHDEITINVPIARSQRNLLKMIASDKPTAKKSITRLKVLQHFKDAALIECELLTGRTHQIRVHLDYIHHNIFNDPLYGEFDGYTNYDQFLHAHYLSFMHPVTLKRISFEVKPDEVFNSLVKKLS
ncbi:MAG: RluA family pseudouridine synthase [Mycoplasmataceae bacterium]|jgi:23S rRNA pseudouridine1911/1915/1917 synthase|nr:RluA family pseudouridine synthase [Mycoplasmataceae bacterium]